MLTISADVLPRHRTAVQASVDLVDGLTPGDLTKPTPCAGWTLADLLSHMTVQHRGFAAAARGRGGDVTVWDPATVADDVSADPAGVYRAAARDVLDAFAVGGVMDVTFALPEFGPQATFPGSMAIGFHFVDYVVHGWDVARSRGVDFRLPDHVVAAALPLALAVPDGEFRAVDGSPFARAIPAAEPLSDIDRILTHLGRCPSWTTPAAEEGSVG
jgi:uncharacterized protein (TIGR03086 family)